MTAQLIIVDDDAYSAAYMQRMLAQQHLHVAVTPTAYQARMLLARQPADLVLLDVALPDASGYEVAQWLRQTHADVGIMFVSGHAGLAERLHAFDAGADDYLCKPILSAEFLARVRALLRRRGAEPPRRVISAGGIVLDCDHALVTLPDGRTIVLDAPMTHIMAAMLARPGQLIALHELARLPGLHTARLAEGAALRLRDTIEPDPLWARYVQVIRNVGARVLVR